MTLSRPLRILLWPTSLLYGLAAAMRVALYVRGWLKQKRLKAAVISVGNLSVGGTGKTPLVIWLAEKLLREGKQVAILSRGYRGTAGSSDEIELMRARLQNLPRFGVGKDRYTQGHAIESREPIDVFLLDDGFQHLQLARDLDIVLMDASRSIAGEFLLPAGPLRERSTALTRADMIVFTRTDNAPGAAEAIERMSNLPVFAASTHLLGFRLLGVDAPLVDSAHLGPGPFFAFCGLGNPEAFVRDLKRWGVPVAGQMFFADHHRYSVDDTKAIVQAAARAGAKALLTTEKDSWNLIDITFTDLPVFVSVIDLQISGQAAFLSAIDHALRARGALT